MDKLHRQSMIGLVAILLAAGLALIVIPAWVNKPANVPHIVLSPQFWPYTTSALMALCGTALFIAGRRSDEIFNDGKTIGPGATARILIFLAGAIAYVWLIPLLGMVFASILAFAATSFMLRPKRPKPAMLCAVLLPLILYVFFAHVASVAIPQGAFVRLP